MSNFYCIDKSTKQILSAGPLPETWGTISGLDVLDYAHRIDMTWAGYPYHVFLNREELAPLNLGVTNDQLDVADAAYKKSTVPSSITMRQARLTFLGANILTALETAIEAIADANTKQVTKIEWQYGEHVLRYNSPVTSLLSSSLGLTELQIDDLFIEGMYR